MRVECCHYREFGGAFVEAAVSLQAFLLLIVIGSQLAVGAYKFVSLQYTVAAAARYASLRQTETAGCGDMTLEKSIEYQVYEIGGKFGLNFGQPFSYAGACTTNGETFNPGFQVCNENDWLCNDHNVGAPYEYAKVEMAHPINLLFFSFNVTGVAFIRNEPVLGS